MTPKTDYTVESKEEVRRLGRAGDVETWYRIWATSKGGTRYHVEVREDELANADAVLTLRAKELDAIQ